MSEKTKFRKRKQSQFRGQWLGRSWTSECRKCGATCYTVADEERHEKLGCTADGVDRSGPGDDFDDRDKRS